jgi:spore maturation protein CgeB
MRFLVAGDWHSDLHESELCKSLQRLGHEAIEFKWFHYFSFDQGASRSALSVSKRIQSKYIIGPLVKRVNIDFILAVRKCCPDVIFVYRGTHLMAESLQTVRDLIPSCRIIGYNNDDPFSPTQPQYLWRHFKSCIPIYDLVLAYRSVNIAEYQRAGARKVKLMRSWYVPDRNYPIELTELDRKLFECDVVFVGHYENDHRLECLESIAQMGYSIRLFGPKKYWEGPLKRSKTLSRFSNIRMVWGIEYNKALCGSKIALCFLSKLNRDTYTRRCFEIPATKTLMLSEYSDDLNSMYKKGVELDFFKDKFELQERVKYYINNPYERCKVAAAGFLRVKLAGYDIDSTVSKMILDAEIYE